MSQDRRSFIAAAAAGTAALAAPPFIRNAFAADDFKIGMFYAIAGPAANLFGPTQKACAELAVDEINAKGGILGRRCNCSSPTATARSPTRPRPRCG